MTPTEIRCERCGEVLEPSKACWLELDIDGFFQDGPVEPPENSQGGFPFGFRCAKAVLDNEGELVRIRGWRG